ncbi:MAG: Sensor protein ZraS [bacterium ADurb.Bin236]|nr:MAG: Sensor protein ZraS [bacterium ADurb.Bin236]HOY62847.1 ATP-binding protein [bacterium]HPN93726.1 ATP-binding protein [bacterium]
MAIAEEMAGNGRRATRVGPVGASFSGARVRLRLGIAIPVLMTLLVLGTGWVILDMNTRELLGKPTPLTVENYQKAVEKAIEHTTIAVVVGGAFSLLVGLALAYAITAPLRRLAGGAASIAGGDLSRSIQVGGDGEIAMLGSAFNNMLASINKYLLQTMSGGVVTINEKARITAASADAEVILGVNSRDLIGRHITEMIPDIKENRQFHTLIKETLEKRATFVGKELAITTENREAIPVSISTSYLRDSHDTLIGLIISFDDVKNLRKIQDQMQVVDRLTTLGGLAAGIAHQVRNPLCSIRGLAQLLKENAEPDSSLCDYSDVILSDVDRIDRVIDRLLRFIQPTSQGWSYESLNDVVDDTLLLAKHEIRNKSIELDVRPGEGLPKIMCQRENLMQAIMNLLVNAFQAIESRGLVRVETSFAPAEGGEEGSIVLKVTDDGPGIADADMARIFEPSFTTKDDGSGFGLSITRQTVEAHGGRIRVRNRPESGAEFTIWLPVRSGEARQARRAEEESASA